MRKKGIASILRISEKVHKQGPTAYTTHTSPLQQKLRRHPLQQWHSVSPLNITLGSLISNSVVLLQCFYLSFRHQVQVSVSFSGSCSSYSAKILSVLWTFFRLHTAVRREPLQIKKSDWLCSPTPGPLVAHWGGERMPGLSLSQNQCMVCFHTSSV